MGYPHFFNFHSRNAGFGTTKNNTGRKLSSPAIIADGNCTMVCVYMSVVLLASSLLYHWTHLAYFDVAGSLALCWFCYSEGKEALENAAVLQGNK